MNLQEEKTEVVESGVIESRGLRRDQIDFLSDVCERYISDNLNLVTDVEGMSLAEIEQIVALELPDYLKTVCESSKSPTKMIYPVLDSMRLIADRRFQVACIFMEAHREVKIGMMRGATNDKIGLETSLN